MVSGPRALALAGGGTVPDTTEERAAQIAALEAKGDRDSLRQARELKYRGMADVFEGPRNPTSGQLAKKKEGS